MADDNKEPRTTNLADDVELVPARGEMDEAPDDLEYSEENLADAVKKLKEQLKESQNEKMEYLTAWQKDKAEFVNARRRDEEAKQEFLKFSKQSVIEEILPVLDSFDLAMGNKASWESVSPEWRKGVENIYNQFLGILGKHGVTAFGAVGDSFDPNLHHSIASVRAEDKSQDHKLAEILQRGYSMSGKTIRPALVKVWEV